MTHDDIRHKLSEYLDNAVTAEEKTAIGDHLAACTECRGAMEELRKALAHVRSLEEVESPPWLTQKIMARVREDAEQKKSLFHRIFYPLSVKLPLQTVAVLFLVVTAYYVYQSMDRSMRHREAPMEYAQQDTLPAPRTEEEIGADKPADRSSALPQTPEYKSLDMKYAYEPPPPPAPAEEAPSAAAPGRVMKREAKPEASVESYAAAAKAPAPVAEEETLEPSTEKRAKKKPMTGLMDADEVREKAAEAPASMQAVGDVEAPAVTYTLYASNSKGASGDVEKIIDHLGGKVVRRDAHSIDAAIDGSKLEELIRQLLQLGRTETKGGKKMPDHERIVIRIQFKGE